MTKKPLAVHPATEIFPLMEDAEFEQLTEDIREHGLHDPIVLYEKQVLDGRNRLRACEIAKVKPVFEEADLNGVTPLQYVVSKNLHRRHLTVGQRAAVAMRLLPQYQEEANEAKREAGKKYGAGHPKEVSSETSKPFHTNDQIAEMVGLGPTTIHKAIAIQKRDPEIIDKMLAGEIKTIAAAERAAGMVPGGDAPISLDLPRIYYGKGDRWREASQPVLRYLRGWEGRGYEFRHVNHTEARRRIKVVDEILLHLNAVREDLEQRSVKATTRMEGR